MCSTYMRDFLPPHMRISNCPTIDKLKLRRKQRRHFRETKSGLSNCVFLDDLTPTEKCNQCDQQQQEQFQLSNISEGEWTSINCMGRLLYPQLIPWQATPEQNKNVQRIVEGAAFKYLTPAAVAAGMHEDEVELKEQSAQKLKGPEAIGIINEQLNSATQSLPRKQPLQLNTNNTYTPWKLHLQGQPKENWPYELEHYHRMHQHIDCPNRRSRVSHKYRNVPIYYRIGIPDSWQLRLKDEEQKCQE